MKKQLSINYFCQSLVLFFESTMECFFRLNIGFNLHDMSFGAVCCNQAYLNETSELVYQIFYDDRGRCLKKGEDSERNKGCNENGLNNNNGITSVDETKCRSRRQKINGRDSLMRDLTEQKIPANPLSLVEKQHGWGQFVELD
jgi:hypothetical protein